MKVTPITTTMQKKYYSMNKETEKTNYLKTESPVLSPNFKGIPKSAKKLSAALCIFVPTMMFPNPFTIMVSILLGGMFSIGALADLQDESKKHK